MLRTADFRLSSIQFTIFTPGLLFIPSKILGFVLTKWGELFDAAPVSMPLPPEAPSEIPRIILQSSDGRSKLELAPSRANMFWLRQADTDEIKAEDFLGLATNLLWEYTATVNGKVGRIAMVLNRFVKHENPGVFLAQHFCKDKWQTAPFNRPESFEIHAHKRYVLNNQFNINSWVRCKTGLIKLPDQQKIILVEQDINTFPEETETREFSNGQIKEFCRIGSNELNSILSLYFPEGELYGIA